MKRYLGVLLVLVLLLVGLAAVASADEVYTIIWDKEDAYLADASTGKVLEFTGWKKANVQYYYGDDDYEIWPNWFYSEGKGKLVQGWKEIDKKWYYLWPEMASQGTYEINGSYCLFDESGAWQVSATKPGWVYENNKWYYLYKYEDEDWCWFVTGGTEIINKTPYFFDKNGVMQCNGWASMTWEWGDEKYTSWVYANPNGDLATGWKKIDGKWYYFSDYGWMYSDDWWTIGGKKYAFEKSGAMLENRWYAAYTWEWEGKVYHDWLYLGEGGAAKTGWFKVGNDWYYADEYGWLYWDMWLEDGGHEYYLTESGAMATGWQQFGGDWFYFKASGAMADKEWIQDGSTWYYLGEGGVMYHSGTYTIDGKEYKFADNGAWIP